MKSETKTCQNCRNDFTIEPDDFGFYEKIKVPPPTFCFHCRLQRKLAYLNFRTLFKRKCANCKKDIISMYRQDSRFTIFCVDCYRNREDCIQYGRDYDFSRTFFEQFLDLYKNVPIPSLKQNITSKKCEYSNHTYHQNRAYLSFMVSRSEDVFYSQQVLMGNKIILDSQNIHMNERGYELVDSSRSYNSRFLIRSRACVDSAFLFNCSNCTDCCMSYNLKNKKYVFRNKQYTREEYLNIMKDYPLDSYEVQEKLSNEFWDFSKQAVCLFASMRNAVNCTGDFIGNSKNTHYSFSLVDTENSKYIIFGANTIRDSYDLAFAGILESCYELVDSGGHSNMMFFNNGHSTGFDIRYVMNGKNNKNLFGCVALENKQYCILNKQYSKKEYEETIPRILEHMEKMPYKDKKDRVYKYGEFFPAELSPFAYNESVAYEEFPMSQKETLKEGYEWRDLEEKQYSITIESSELPESINDVKDDILEQIITCPNKGKVETKCTFGFRIIPDELRYYRLMKIPLPRYCPNCRYYERRKWLNPWKLWHRTCMCDKDGHFHGKEKCKVEFETSYAPNRPEIVYCEKCYQQEVY